MSDEPRKPRSEADAALEREIRDGRKFTLAEAIGRLAGPGMMKGVSPATGKQQAAALIEGYLERHSPDSSGALSAVLLRQVRESELLIANLDQPLVVLAGFVQRALDSDFLLQELVRESDVEWGRTFGERPYFQKEGCPPHQDDPYTIESVRSALSALLATLRADAAAASGSHDSNGQPR
jgi:broad specificity phosphatase PhoE